MAKIESIGQGNAHATLHSALEEINLEDSIYIIVRTKDDRVSTYWSNYKNAYLYWDLAVAMDDVLDIRRKEKA